MESEVFRKIPEVMYLTVTNAGRYRGILRYCYAQHERMNHYVKAEEIYEALRNLPAFQEITLDELLRDLDNLKQWGNLTVRQDTGRVHSIEEFKKSRYQYSCTPYTVEIERMVQRLENLGDGFGGSLEKTRFERLHEQLVKFINRADIEQYNEEELYRDWEEIVDLFNKIWQNASDYTASLASERLTALSQTEAFLSYKDNFVGYLKNFIISLQTIQPRIEKVLSQADPKWEQSCFDRIAQYEQKMKILVSESDEGAEKEKERLIDQFHSLQRWFLGKGQQKSEAVILQEITNEAIRRMTKMIQRITERRHKFRSRKQDFLHIAKWFHEANDLNEANEIYAILFGLDHTQHYYGLEDKTENINTEVWEMEPEAIGLKGANRQTSRNTRVQSIRNKSAAKRQETQRHLQKVNEQEELLNRFFVAGTLELTDELYVPMEVRKMLLTWLSRTKFKRNELTSLVQTDYSYQVKIERIMYKTVRIQSEDGYLQMPAFRFMKVGASNGQ